MDDQTRQGVLANPQKLGVLVQAVCPPFLQRKERAKVKPKVQLTKIDNRLLVDFGPVNNKIKDMHPTPMTPTEEYEQDWNIIRNDGKSTKQKSAGAGFWRANTQGEVGRRRIKKNNIFHATP